MWAYAPANFREFLRKFVTLRMDEWASWERAFVKRPESPWVNRDVSVDMLKQFLTRQVTEAAVANVVVKTSRPEHSGFSAATFSVCEDDIFWETKPNKINDFFKIMCDCEAAKSFFEQYASATFVRDDSEHVIAES